MSDPPAERRSARRIPLQAIVHYQIDGSEFINLSSNISADGIFIKNFSPPEVGTELAIQVQLPAEQGGHRLELLGRVVRVAEGGTGQERGMGVAFTALRACAPEAIRFFVNEIFEVDALERLAAAEPAGEGCEHDEPGYQAPAGEVLRLSGAAAPTGTPAASIFGDSRQRLLWSTLLVAVGALLGAGLVLVFLIGD